MPTVDFTKDELLSEISVIVKDSERRMIKMFTEDLTAFHGSLSKKIDKTNRELSSTNRELSSTNRELAKTNRMLEAHVKDPHAHNAARR